MSQRGQFHWDRRVRTAEARFIFYNIWTAKEDYWHIGDRWLLIRCPTVIPLTACLRRSDARVLHSVVRVTLLIKERLAGGGTA